MAQPIMAKAQALAWLAHMDATPLSSTQMTVGNSDETWNTAKVSW